MKKILVQRGKKKEIVQKLGATYPTVKTALDGHCDSFISQQIRQIAIELGGVYKSED